MACPPTITRPHRASAASLITEGQQRVFHAQPIEHLSSSSHSHGKSSIHHKTTQSTCCLLHGGSTASPSCTTYRAPAIFLTYSWHVLQPSQDHTEHLLPPSRWVNQQVLHAQPIEYLPSSSHIHGKSCNHNRTT